MLPDERHPGCGRGEGPVPSGNHMTGRATGPAIDAHGLGFAFRKKTILRDLSLEVAAGEAVVLLGSNGAGKTTLLRILAGEVGPDDGTVRVLGGDPTRPSVRRAMTFMREQPLLADFLSVTESIRFHAAMYDRKAPTGKALDDLLDRFGLREAAKKWTAKLSKGMKRRLELLQAVVVDAPVWLLDEPGSGLDPDGLRLFREIVREARDRGRAVLFSSHALADTVLAADRTLILRQGTLAFAGDRAALMARVGAQALVFNGAGDDLVTAVRQLAESRGVRVDGPEVPLELLEKMLIDGTPR